MDHSQSTAHSTKSPWCSQSLLFTSPSTGKTRDHNKEKGRTALVIQQHPSPIPRLQGCVRTTKRKGVAIVATLEPCYWPKTRSPTNANRKNNTTLTVRTGWTFQIPEEAHSIRNNMTIKKPKHCTLLLYQKEKWEIMTSARLPTGECLNHQEPLPPTPYTSAYQPPAWLHPVHQVWHWMGIQQSPH